MITIRCTQRLLKRSGLEVLADPPPPSAVLGEWYANVVCLPFPGRSLILYMHDPSRLSVLVCGRTIHTTVDPFRHRAICLLERLGIPAELLAAERREMSEVCFARTASRSMLGSMNEIANQIWYRVQMQRSRDELDLDALERELADVPHGPLNYERPEALVKKLWQARRAGAT